MAIVTRATNGRAFRLNPCNAPAVISEILEREGSQDDALLFAPEEGRTFDSVEDNVNRMQSVVAEEAQNTACIDAISVPLQAPNRVKARGRPNTLRLKSISEFYGAKSKRIRHLEDLYCEQPRTTFDLPEALIPPGPCAGTKREVRCTTCKKSGHNRSTCGRSRE
ncbi:hypothetical protein ACP70R_015117 [Stipagrostis hirtigluma subsp. patula]